MIDMDRAKLMKIIRKLASWFVRLEINGAENLLEQGAFLLATSHISRLDTPFLMLSTDREDVRGMVAREYRDTFFLGWVLDNLDVIWVTRGTYDFEAFREAVTYLKKGSIVGIAPEGTRSKDQTLLEGKPGVALLAFKTGVPIVPAAVNGSTEMLNSFLKFRRMRVVINFGEPFQIQNIAPEQENKERLIIATDEIMCRIALLLPPERWGFYADHPRLKELLQEERFPKQKPI